MLFNSVIFIFFFLPLSLLFYYLTPNPLQKLSILTISLLFILWSDFYFAALFFMSLIINYLLYKMLKDRQSKAILWSGIIFNLLPLIFFKYFDIFMFNLFENESIFGNLRNLAMPLGISFYSFKGIAFIMDVYHKKIKKTSFIDFAIFYSLFSTFLAGPILTYENSQFLNHKKFDIEIFSEAIERFIFGLAKKVVIAGSLAYVVDSIYAQLQYGIDLPTAWIGVIFYSFQIYFDFSGYSDMAIALSNMFNISVPENFNYPYYSKSISEFWRRWHISLSNWFKNYLYIPLGGNRTRLVYFNLLIVFVATGLWHGSSINYLFWGLWHGFFILVDKVLSKHKIMPISDIFKISFTFFVVSLGWVLFRSLNVDQAVAYFSSLFIQNKEIVTFSWQHYLGTYQVLIIVLAITFSFPWYKKFVGNLHQAFRYAFVILLFIISIMYLVSGSYSPFIYFKF